MLFPTTAFAILASLLSISAVLAMPAPETASHTTLSSVGRDSTGNFADSKVKSARIQIHFPPVHPTSECTLCGSKEGCQKEGNKLQEWAWASEFNLAWRADSDYLNWWAAQLNRTVPGKESFAIVNRLKHGQEYIFEMVAMDSSEAHPNGQNSSVWTKVKGGQSCLTTSRKEMKYFPEHLSVVNVYTPGTKKAINGGKGKPVHN